MRITPFAAFQGIEEDPAHSPSTTAPQGGEYGLPFEDANARSNPNNTDGFWPGATANQKYITPSIGGEAGPRIGLGWTTGLRPIRERRMRLDGRTLVVKPGQAANPIVGQVGRDTRGSDLAMRVTALNTDFLPPIDVIAASFTQRGGSALQREILG